MFADCCMDVNEHGFDGFSRMYLKNLRLSAASLKIRVPFLKSAKVVVIKSWLKSF